RGPRGGSEPRRDGPSVPPGLADGNEPLGGGHAGRRPRTAASQGERELPLDPRCDARRRPEEFGLMIRVVGVRFKKAGKVYYFDPGELTLSIGDQVVVETARGLELGEVVVRPKHVPEEDVAQPLRKVIRAATPEDVE